MFLLYGLDFNPPLLSLRHVTVGVFAFPFPSPLPLFKTRVCHVPNAGRATSDAAQCSAVQPFKCAICGVVNYVWGGEAKPPGIACVKHHEKIMQKGDK